MDGLPDGWLDSVTDGCGDGTRDDEGPWLTDGSELGFDDGKSDGISDTDGFSVSGAGGSSFMNKSSQDYGNRVSIIPSTTQQVVIGTRSSVTREIFDQDGNTDADNNSSNTAQDTFVVGATWDGTSRSPVADYSGKVYEVIVYGVKLTEAQRNQVQNYLQTKWNT